MLLMLPLRRMALLSLLALATACSKDDETPATPDTPELTTFEKTVSLPAGYLPPTDVTELTDGSLFVLAAVDASSEGSYIAQRLAGIHLTASGDTLWTRRYIFGPFNRAYGAGYGYHCLPTTDGNIVFSAMTPALNGELQTRLTKLNTTTGAVLWTLPIPGQVATSPCYLASTAGGFLFLDNTDNQGFRLHTITNNGTLASTITLPYGEISNIQPTNDGNFIVASIQEPLSQQPQLVLTKLTPQGSVLWSRISSTPGVGVATRLVQTPDGGYAMASCMPYGGPKGNIILLKTDANGQQQFVRSYTNAEGMPTRLGLSAGKLVLVGGFDAYLASGARRFYPMILGLDPTTGNEEQRQIRPQVNGYVVNFIPTRDGKLLFCSSEAGKLVLRKTNADLTD